MGRLEFEGMTVMLLEAFEAEEKTDGELLDVLILALSRTGAEEAFRRLSQACGRLLQSGKAEGQIRDLKERCRAALFVLPNPTTTEELLKVVQGDDSWQQELAAAELVRQGRDRGGGRLRLLRTALHPGAFPEPVWQTLMTVEFSEPRGIEAIRQAPLSEIPRPEVHDLAMAERIPAALCRVLVPELIALVEKEKPDSPVIGQAAGLISVPRSPEDVKRLARLLFSWRPAETTPFPGIRAPVRDIRFRLGEPLCLLTTGTLQAAFIDVLDEFTTPGVELDHVIETLNVAKEVVRNWSSGAGHIAMVKAVSRLEEHGHPIPEVAAHKIRQFPITQEQLEQIPRWKPGVASRVSGEADVCLTALTSSDTTA